jgi:Domain of unknown function (DUF4389)
MRVVASIEQRPITLVVREHDLGQSRLTVLFRVLLVLPHIVWLVLWSFLATVVGWIGWVTAIVLGRLPLPLHRFLSAYLRYSVHVFAYLSVATRRFPGFAGRPGYEFDVEIAPPEKQRRLGVLFRQVLAYPSMLLAFVVAAGGVFVVTPSYFLPFLIAVAVPLWGVGLWFAILAWWSALIRGRMSSGLRDFTFFGNGYRAQQAAYSLFLTSRYPHASPSVVQPALTLPPDHPVRLRLTGELRRSRLTVLFRLFLAIPHLVWVSLWTVAALLAAIAAWFAALVTGRVPGPLHRFLAAYIRYRAHLDAFVTIVGGPFPGFVGKESSYPLDLEIDPPERQRRLVTLLRVFLVIPAALLLYPMTLALLLCSVGIWFFALVLGRAPEGLCDLGAAVIRYLSQVGAYVFLVTARYPHSSPAVHETAETEGDELTYFPTPTLGDTF